MENRFSNYNYRPFRIVSERGSIIRALARQALKGRWLEAFVLLLAAWAISALPSYLLATLNVQWVDFITGIYSMVISGPVSLGVSYYFLKLFRQRPAQISDLRYGFEYFSKALLLYLNMVIRIFLWSLLFVIPGIVAAFRYSMAPYILADDPSKSPHQCLVESSLMMAGNKMNYFFLLLGFLGWGLLASIPQSWVGAKAVEKYNDSYFYFRDPQILVQIFNDTAYSIKGFVASLPEFFVKVYILVSTACFYDLANGNLTVGGYDYMRPSGSVENPYSGESVPFRDVPPQTAPDSEEEPGEGGDN